jgi:hypothetical protein
MKNLKNLFTISVSDTEYFNDGQEKFELVSCPVKENYCSEIRPAINKYFQESQLYRRDKIYQKSIESLHNAHNCTTKLTEPSCANCAAFFRSTINQSLQTIQKERQKSTAGLFGFKLPGINFLKLESVLEEI